MQGLIENWTDTSSDEIEFVFSLTNTALLTCLGSREKANRQRITNEITKNLLYGFMTCYVH